MKETKLSQHSVLKTILLTIITLGIYQYFWLFKKQHEIQSNYQIQVVDSKWILMAFILYGIGWILVLPGAYFGIIGDVESENTIRVISDVLTYVDLLIMTVFSFLFRSKILQVFHACGHELTKINRLLTLIFGIFYLQYKINKVDTLCANMSETIRR